LATRDANQALDKSEPISLKKVEISINLINLDIEFTEREKLLLQTESSPYSRASRQEFVPELGAFETQISKFSSVQTRFQDKTLREEPCTMAQLEETENREVSIKTIPFSGLDKNWREWHMKVKAVAKKRGWRSTLLNNLSNVKMPYKGQQGLR
jgi:hypothetical protein